jgi:hypothetical protein
MDDEFADYQDSDSWITDENSIVDPSGPVSATVSIQFSREEIRKIDEAAERSGMLATEFIKHVALARARIEVDVTANASATASRTSLRKGQMSELDGGEPTS